MKAIQHPELLPAFALSQFIVDFCAKHPEAAEAYVSLYREDVNAKSSRMIQELKQQTISAEELTATVRTWYTRLVNLAAPDGNWN